MFTANEIKELGASGVLSVVILAGVWSLWKVVVPRAMKMMDDNHKSQIDAINKLSESSTKALERMGDRMERTVADQTTQFTKTIESQQGFMLDMMQKLHDITDHRVSK
jgi:hypothetical protein